MITVTASIPDDLAPQAGDRLHLEARVLADGSFMVVNAINLSRKDKESGPRMSLTEWVKKYAGTMQLSEGESRECLRNDYLNDKFGN